MAHLVWLVAVVIVAAAVSPGGGGGGGGDACGVVSLLYIDRRESKSKLQLFL